MAVSIRGGCKKPLRLTSRRDLHTPHVWQRLELLTAATVCDVGDLVLGPVSLLIDVVRDPLPRHHGLKEKEPAVMGTQNCDRMLPLPKGLCLVAVMHTRPQDCTGRINAKVNCLCTRLIPDAGVETGGKIVGGDQLEVFVVAWICLVTADWKGGICRTAD